jgi:hypothetical protein
MSIFSARVSDRPKRCRPAAKRFSRVAYTWLTNLIGVEDSTAMRGYSLVLEGVKGGAAKLLSLAAFVVKGSNIKAGRPPPAQGEVRC